MFGKKLKLTRQKALLLKCLAATIALHIGLLVYFFAYPPKISARFLSLFGEKTRAEESAIYYQARSFDLEGALETIVVAPSSQISLFDEKKILTSGEFSPLHEQVQTPINATLSLEENKHLQVDENLITQAPTLTLPEEIEAGLIEKMETLHATFNLQIDRPSSSNWSKELIAFADRSPADVFVVGESIYANHAKASLQEIPEESEPLTWGGAFPRIETDFSLQSTRSSFDEKNLGSLPLALRSSSVSHAIFSNIPIGANLPSFSSYTLPTTLPLIEWSDAFKYQLSYQEAEDGGYYFVLYLLPKKDFSEERISQNYHFFIDRSNSVGKSRFSNYKKGVRKALSYLQKGDTFNITLLDRKALQLSEKNLPFSRKTQRIAERFLDEQESGNLFAATHIFNLFATSTPKNLSEIQGHTFIFLTDGEKEGAFDKQLETMQPFINKNQKRIVLYTASVGNEANNPLLETLGKSMGGNLINSKTNAAFPRRIAREVLHAQNLIGKEIVITAFPSKESHMHLFQSDGRLYAKKPFMIVGKVDALEPFSVLIQGKHKNKVLNIKKTISFEKGEKSDQVISLVHQTERTKALLNR